MPLTRTASRRAASPGLMIFTGLLVILPAFTNIRLGSLQPADLSLLLLLGYCCAKFLVSGFSLRIATHLSSLFRSYMLLLLLLFLFSLLSVRLPFFPLAEASFLKQPVIFSLSKLLQFAAIICGFLWLSNALLEDEKLLQRVMNWYWITGIVCALYAILCFLAITAGHLDMGTSGFGAISGAYRYDGAPRARGFFIEGGPFGVYLVSVFMVGYIRRYLSGKSLGKLNVAILAAAFILAASKAAFFVAIFLFLYIAISAASFIKKVSYFIVFASLLWGVAVFLNFGDQISGYIYSYQNLEEQVAQRGFDDNLVVGRVAASYIVPRMIAAHPFTGIGFGNYPLMRNDPHYRGVLPDASQIEDIPGIGFPGIAAEFGIPATLWLILLLLVPARRIGRKASILGGAAIFQLLAHTFAVQLTFFYPWIVSACVIAASSHTAKRPNQRLAALK